MRRRPPGVTRTEPLFPYPTCVQSAVFLDPGLQVQWKGQHGLLRESRNALDFDRDWRGQRVEAERGAAGRAGRVGEVLAPDRVVGLEIARHVGEVDGHV